MRVMIGIPAYNEEANIRQLLDTLLHDLSEEIETICVVSSGSQDRTNEIVRDYERRYSQVLLVAEIERRGKASALNQMIRIGERFDVIVCLGGDNIPEDGAIEALLEPFKSEEIGIVGGRPLPLNPRGSFLGWCAHMTMNLHHLVSLESPKISGELFAFKSNVVREMPPGLINDDVYLQSLIEIRNYRSDYVPAAEVYMMGPRTVEDFVNQRRRVFVGHSQAEFLLGRRIPTYRLRVLRLLKKAMPTRGVKGSVFCLGFLLLITWSWTLSRWDILRRNLPYRWKISTTTKRLRYGL